MENFGEYNIKITKGRLQYLKDYLNDQQLKGNIVKGIENESEKSYFGFRSMFILPKKSIKQQFKINTYEEVEDIMQRLERDNKKNNLELELIK